jgi:hypothetical protein
VSDRVGPGGREGGRQDMGKGWRVGGLKGGRDGGREGGGTCGREGGREGGTHTVPLTYRDTLCKVGTTQLGSGYLG